MRLLIWHWGRFGAGPRYAALPAAHLRGVAGITPLLSLPDTAELLHAMPPDRRPELALPVRTYAGLPGFAARALCGPFLIPALADRLRSLELDAALCAMPAMLDWQMAAALRRCGLPWAVVVHDAVPHPGERVPMQHRLQKRLLRQANALVTLSTGVAETLRRAWPDKPLTETTLPPLFYGDIPSPAWHDGPPRLLFFGRLLPYKGLDLLAGALQGGPRYDVRVVGRGPDSAILHTLQTLPGVRVENRWVPDGEITALLGWADALVLPYREASQSGVAATALAAGRFVLATRVGGLPEQLAGEARAILCQPDTDSLRNGLETLHAALQQGWNSQPYRPGPQSWTAMVQHLAPALCTVLQQPGRTCRKHPNTMD